MKKILIANRGEIAFRILRTAKKMGIKVAAVYSEADRFAPFVRYADEAVCIGPPPSTQSYLNKKKIVEAAKELNADGIHPGYGFLSENAEFARLVEENGIAFIGPKPASILTMGSKLAAKKAVAGFGIPMVPGTEESITDFAKARKVAAEIGFPVLIKASAGGGGKGMRVVHHEKELEEQMIRAISEAESAFGDGSVFIEKFILSPRHIEIQILADKYGKTIHLFERECSIQRRHQKIIEEAPSSVLSPELREKMGQAAIMVAQSCEYTGAGTVEFLLDENLNFYFLEMNTRLQVEHPVTEMITGVDLVEQQIRIARGETLQIEQEDLRINGHAIELRIYAEDPFNDFLPSTGILKCYSYPESPNIRLDSGYEEGMEIPIFYDSMIAKLVAWGDGRQEAIQNMIEAIENFQIEGVATTLAFGQFAFKHDAFKSGNFDTNFIKRYFNKENFQTNTEEESKVAALIALQLLASQQKRLKPIHTKSSRWKLTRK